MGPRILIKVVGGIAATIILGAVGSGLWERVLAPGLDWSFRTSVDLVSSLSLNYKNGIYRSAAQGFHEDYSLRVFAIVSLMLSLAAMVSTLVRDEHMRRVVLFLVRGRKEWLHRAALVGSLAFSLVVFYSIGHQEAVNRTVTYSIRSMDILRPHVGEQEYFAMLAEFYQIKSAKQFQHFHDSIIREARAAAVTLPEFEPL